MKAQSAAADVLSVADDGAAEEGADEFVVAFGSGGPDQLR